VTRSIVTGLAVGVGWAWGLCAAVAALVWWLERQHPVAQAERAKRAAAR